MVYYFKAVTKGKKIPNTSKIMKLAKEHDLELFSPPEEREFASVYVDEQFEDDSDYDESEDSEGE